MYISIRNAFTTNPELYTEAISQKLVLFRAIVNGTDEEFTSALNSFNKTFALANQKSPMSSEEKKFLVFYTWFQIIPILSIHGIIETEFNMDHIKFYYELETCDFEENYLEINSRFFNSARQYYKVSRKDNEHSAFIKECIQYIEDTLYEKFDLETLAHKMSYNSYYLSKKFKKETKMSINQYVLKTKINEARRLLEKKQSIRSISTKLAFSSQSYFTECFKKTIGITPKQYQYLIKK